MRPQGFIYQGPLSLFADWPAISVHTLALRVLNMCLVHPRTKSTQYVFSAHPRTKSTQCVYNVFSAHPRTKHILSTLSTLRLRAKLLDILGA